MRFILVNGRTPRAICEKSRRGCRTATRTAIPITAREPSRLSSGIISHSGHGQARRARFDVTPTRKASIQSS
jgi:hypothetical protein